MIFFSMRQAAKKLGLSIAALSSYVAKKKVPAPEPQRIGKQLVYAWSEKDIERVRKILPKIVNGRKIRWEKERAEKKVPKKSSKKK